MDDHISRIQTKLKGGERRAAGNLREIPLCFIFDSHRIIGTRTLNKKIVS
jgi:hypothetical protein